MLIRTSLALISVVLSTLPCIAVAQTSPDSFTLPDGFTIERVTPPGLTDYPMFMAFDDQGRMFIAESTGKDLSGQEMIEAPECQILRLEDTNDDGIYDTRTVFATDLSLPMGILWHQGSLFVASPPDFLRFDDTDNDGVADHREILLTGWNMFNTASLHGPFLGPDGRLYLTHGRHGYKIETKEGTILEGLAARIWRCWPDGTGLERFAGGGFDNPVELAFLPSGEMIGTMTYFTNPKFGQRDALLHYVWGGVYPKPHESIAEFVRTGPDLMPVMSKFSRIAPSGLERYRGTAFGEGYTDNLFSAQFNPHRVQFHRLIRDGATYRTEEQDFLTSTSPDFFPTDVLEDADGSLLISDTGAWYVDACPVSRIAKPEVKGAIYRVRRSDAPAVVDPWGKKIDWPGLTTGQLAERLSDSRVRVQDRALAFLIARGSESVAELETVLTTSKDDAARLHALTAVRQIDHPRRNSLIRQALTDSSMDIRLAAAQAAGDLRDADAVPELIRILQQGSPPEQREAATALGRIGDSTATKALLASAGATSDRFVEHATIFSLIELEDRAALFSALESGLDRDGDLTRTTRAALIALDQLNDPRLQSAHIIPFLKQKDRPDLLSAGLWIASRHAEFANDILAHMKDRLEDKHSTLTENDREVLLAYMRLDACRDLIGNYLLDADVSSPDDAVFFLLDTIDKSDMAAWPESWVQGMDRCLHATDSDTVRWRALGLIRSRNIGALDGSLIAIIRNPAEDDAFRLSAMSALVNRDPQLSPQENRFILSNLDRSNDPSLRQAAARLLPRVELDDSVKLELARDYLPQADGLVLSSMLESFQGETDEALGMALVAGLDRNENAADTLNPGQLDAALAAFPPSVQQKADTLRSRMSHRDAALIERFTKLEERLGTGDVGRGRRLFFGDVATCYTCHAIGTDGGDLGPDLTTIGEVRTGHDLLEAVMFPNSSFVPDFTPYLVETESDLLMGLIGRESADGITLKTAAHEEQYIPRSAIRSMDASAISMMPEGLDAGLSDAELIDLITFLQSLNGNVFLEPSSD